MRISGRTFIISGGASGLGLATARDLHAHGGAIALLDLNLESGEKVIRSIAKDVKDGNDRLRFFEVDVTDSEAIGRAVDGAARWAKETGLEIGGVVAAAGIGLPGLVC